MNSDDSSLLLRPAQRRTEAEAIGHCPMAGMPRPCSSSVKLRRGKQLIALDRMLPEVLVITVNTSVSVV